MMRWATDADEDTRALEAEFKMVGFYMTEFGNTSVQQKTVRLS